MDELRNVFLSIVTENQKQQIKAEILADLLRNELGGDWEIQAIEKYHKFKNSFRIDLKLIINGSRQELINHLVIRLADKIASPWLLYFDNFENSIELIYNKDNNTQIRKADFNVIKWGHFEITKC